jgi:putative membrane protein
MLDVMLASFHHLAIFGLIAAMAAEYALLRGDPATANIAVLARLDALYGGMAALVIVAGVLRVALGAAGWQYYVGNWVFWGKMGAFLLVGILSIPGTMLIARWRNRAVIDPAFGPQADGLARIRSMLHLQFGVLAVVPIMAAAMARGFGTL